MAAVLPLVSFFVACNDQPGNRIIPVMKLDTHAYPVGGLETFYQVLRRSITYPASSRENHKSGRVLIGFDVNEDGALSDHHIIDSPDLALSNEVVRVLSLSPLWVPALRNGSTVREHLVLPVMFVLDYPGKKEAVRESEFADNEPDPSYLHQLVVTAYVDQE